MAEREYQKRETIVYDYAHVTGDALVKDGRGVLHTVTINQCGTAGTLTIYDNDTEAVPIIAAIAIPINALPVTLRYDLEFDEGLYLGFDATLVADLTVSYR